VPDGCARTVISLEANALLSHEVVNTPPPRGCFRISTVLWLYPTEPIQRDYTPLRTANMSPEEVAAYRAEAPARWAVGAARRSAAAKKASAAAYGADAYGADPTALRSAAAKKGKDKMGPDRRSAAVKKGRAKMGTERRRAAAKKASDKMRPDRRRAAAKSNYSVAAAQESNYSIGIRTPAQKEKLRKAGALPSVFMSAHKVVLSPHPN
jgi:hypothetical protein